MKSFRLMSMVASTLMVLSVGAFLVPRPNTASKNIGTAASRIDYKDATCIPNEEQLICP